MIYTLWLWKNNPVANAAYARISAEDQKAQDLIFSAEAMERYGAAWVLYCSSAWANEEYRNWGICTYKSIEDRINHTREIEKAGWYRYADMVSFLGTLATDEPSLPGYPNPNPIKRKVFFAQ